MKIHDKLIPKIESSSEYKNYQQIVIMSINDKKMQEWYNNLQLNPFRFYI